MCSDVRCKKCYNVIEPTFTYDDEVFVTDRKRVYCYVCSPYVPYGGISPVEKRNKRALTYKNQRISDKHEIIMCMGGKCQKCGYNKNLTALELHHIDPYTKDFEINSSTIKELKRLGKLQEELDKCILLCANCHREEHNPDYQLNPSPVLAG